MSCQENNGNHQSLKIQKVQVFRGNHWKKWDPEDIYLSLVAQSLYFNGNQTGVKMQCLGPQQGEDGGKKSLNRLGTRS